MKLSEILKDWPEKQPEHTTDYNNTYGSYSHTEDGKRYFDILENQGFNTALTSCDREIDKEALAKVIFSYNFPTEKWEEVHENTNKHYLLLADHIISTMPTWLKRIEDK